MGLDLKSTEKYIPLFGDQRKEHKEDPDYKPVTIHIRKLSDRVYKQYVLDQANTLEKEGENRKVTIQTFDGQAQLFCDHVFKIENLMLDGKPIETGEALIHSEFAPQGLVSEIEDALVDLSQLSKAEVKNLPASLPQD